MKRLYILLLLLFIVNSLNSISRIDILEKKLKTVVAEEKIKTLNALSEEYRYIDPDKSIVYGNDALALAIKYKDNKQKCVAYDNIATANAILGDYEQSLKYYSFSLESVKEMSIIGRTSEECQFDYRTGRQNRRAEAAALHDGRHRGRDDCQQRQVARRQRPGPGRAGNRPG